jgi:hypothetical protein
MKQATRRLVATAFCQFSFCRSRRTGSRGRNGTLLQASEPRKQRLIAVVSFPSFCEKTRILGWRPKMTH